MKRNPVDSKPAFDDRLQALLAMPAGIVRGLGVPATGPLQGLVVAASEGRFATPAHPAQTTLQVAQARLSQAIPVGALFLWDVDSGTGQRRYDDDVALLLGYPQPRSVDEVQFVSAMEPADRAAESESFTQALNPDGDICNWTCRLNGVDGVQRVVEASGRRVSDDSGRMAHFSGVLRDVTEATRSREKADDRALFAEQLVGIVSHDLRNPLSAILMGVKLLNRGESDPKRLLTLERVSNSALRAQRLIELLLDFTLARAGPGLTVVREPLDLHGLVFGVVDELELACPDSVFVHRRRGSGACMADADRIAQLLGNLLRNAIAYGTPGAAVTVTSEVTAQRATVSVHNWGHPIPAEVLPAVFEPMVRCTTAGKSERSVGLGLFIVRAIALAHGGAVDVVSTQDEGTTFTLTFPAA